MRAIDYAAKFFRQAIKTDLDHIQLAYLCAIGAGLDTEYDIARFLGYTNEQAVSRILGKLTRAQLIGWSMDEFAECRIYTLLPKGKETIKQLLSFLPTKAKS